jgi:hypothetical protein
MQSVTGGRVGMFSGQIDHQTREEKGLWAGDKGHIPLNAATETSWGLAAFSTLKAWAAFAPPGDPGPSWEEMWVLGLWVLTSESLVDRHSQVILALAFTRLQEILRYMKKTAPTCSILSNSDIASTVSSSIRPPAEKISGLSGTEGTPARWNLEFFSNRFLLSHCWHRDARRVSQSLDPSFAPRDRTVAAELP